MGKLRRLLLLLLIALTFLASASACSPGSAAAPKACALLTPEVAAQFLDAPVGPAESPVFGGAGLEITSCLYRAGERSIMLVVTRAAEPGTTRVRDIFETARSNSLLRYGAPARDIRGVGDQAFWVSAAPANTLHVLLGDVKLELVVNGPTSAAPSAALLSLAQQLVTQLPIP